MTSRTAATRSSLAAGIKLAIFSVISLLTTGLLVVIMGNIGLGAGKTYDAIFTNASTLEKGDDVRVAGVSVGEVKKVEHYERTMAKVTFRIDADIELTTASTAEIRFLNLVGDRYMALEQGQPGRPTRTPSTRATPSRCSRPVPSLDLTVLFDGFKPLFQALTPDQVNELSMNLVQVLQGEGGTVRGLLEHTASLTTALANRDQLIGSVVTNLSETLDTVNRRHVQLSDLVIELKDWMRDLARDRKTIGGSLDNISDLTVTVADLLRRGRPLLKRDITALHDLAKLLNDPDQRAEVVDLLDRMPEVMSDQIRTGTYGSWYQYYVCAASVRLDLPVLGSIPIIDQIESMFSQLRVQVHRSEVSGPMKNNDARIMRLGVITLVVMAVDLGCHLQPVEVPGLPRHDLLRRVQRRQRHPQGQHRPGRRDPGRPGQRRHPRRGPGDREVRDRRRRRRVRSRLQGLDRGAQPARGEVPRPGARRGGRARERRARSRSRTPRRPTTSSACSAT